MAFEVYIVPIGFKPLFNCMTSADSGLVTCDLKTGEATIPTAIHQEPRHAAYLASISGVTALLEKRMVNFSDYPDPPWTHGV